MKQAVRRSRRRSAWLLPLLGLAVPALAQGTASAPTVTLTSGTLSGTVEDGVAVWRGVPYAAAPTGALRWKPPQPAPAWSGTRAATSFGAVCPQPIEPWMKGESAHQSEDCLSLSVWAPADAKPGAKLPVMMWIHGGGYTAGAGSQTSYDGRAFARRGAVIVTINYRLGLLGFLAHPALSAENDGASGNYGLMDQVAALRWIRDNVARFGGDPANVTIAGESAGAGSVLLLMTAPSARGLFARAIVESGAALGLPENTHPVPTLAQAEADGTSLAHRLHAETPAALRAVPLATLLAAKPSPVSQRPIADGHVVTDDPTLAFRAGHQADVPLLIGWNSAEGTLFANPASVADYQASVRTATPAHADALLRLYPPMPGTPIAEVAAAELADTTFGWRNWSVADAHAHTGRAPAYVYYFDRHGPRDPGPHADTAGALHSEELPFVWLPPMTAAWSAADKALGDQVQGYWFSFMKNGDPNGAGRPAWSRFTGGEQAAVLDFNTTPQPSAIPRLDKLRAVDAVVTGRTSGQ